MGRRTPLTVVAAVLVMSAAACGTVTSRGGQRAAPPPPPGLATSLDTTGATWAVAVLGGSAARHDNFWQLFARPAKSAAWRLVTPPGVASNGGLVLAGLPGSDGQPGPDGQAGRSVIAGFLASQSLAFSPLATTRDDGASWRASVLDARLADVPDALAAAPGGGRLLALLASGGIQQAGPDAAAWSPLTSMHALAATSAGHRCEPAAVAAVAFSPSGDPLLAATCSRPGVVGIFSYAAGTWRPAGPPLPSSEVGQRVQVLRLARTAAGEAALLAARSGRSAGLLAGWSRDGRRWTVSGPFGLGATAVRASGFAASGSAWVLLANGQADVIAARGAAWRQLPRPPRRTAALAFGPAGSVDALAADGSQLTVWRLGRGSTSWRQVQVLHVPLAYGSSG
jgi:hypothetical protein